MARGAVALAGLSAVARRASGMAEARTIIPPHMAARRTTYASWLPEAPEDAEFRTLALVAIDAATRAGADFADVRIGVIRECSGAAARLAMGYGIRVRVAGTWSFRHGTVLAKDTIAASARTATIGARTANTVNARIGWYGIDPIATIPSVTGEWHVPVEIDPFTVPVDDFLRVEAALRESCRRLGFLVGAGVGLSWVHERRIFASTDGSLVTQSFTHGGADMMAGATLPDGGNPVSFLLSRPGGESAGFELMLRTDFTDRLVATAEDAIRWRELPEKSFDDVGRFPVVFDGATFAGIVGNTLSLTLDGDRLSGLEADASGRSFLQPFSAHPVQPPPEFSPLLTIGSHRSLPSSIAAYWDDDGVAVTPCTLVDRGTVVNFHTTRETAPLFDGWYRDRHRPNQLCGRSVAPTPASLPMANGGDVNVLPATTKTSEADLYREMTHGFYMRHGDTQPAPGLTTGLIGSSFVAEIVHGKPVARIYNLNLAFITNAVLKTGLAALGDASTVATNIVSTQKGMPWQTGSNPVSAPAAYCKEVDILRMDLSR